MPNLMSRLDEERRHAEQYRVRLVKTTIPIIQNQKSSQSNQNQEVCSRRKTSKRKFQRKLDDSQEDFGSLQQELIKHKSKFKRSNKSNSLQNNSHSTDFEVKNKLTHSSKNESKPNFSVRSKENLRQANPKKMYNKNY